MVSGAEVGVGGPEVMAKSMRFLLGVMKCSKSDGIDACVTLDMLKTHPTVYFKRVNCVVCELYPPKAALKPCFPHELP